MTELCALASGSNGNCYYVGNGAEAVLIDAGITARRIVTRMKERNLSPLAIKAIFISHEHSDHVSGARVLSKRLSIPVFLTMKTYAAVYSVHKPLSPRFFSPGDSIAIGSITVHPFLKNHDAAEPCSFRIECGDCHIGVFTDIGSCSDQLVQHLGMCHAVFLETNYDEKMLWEGRYPWSLKKRIASDRGHMSNDQAFELLETHSGNNLHTVFLSHLSAENNTVDTARERFTGVSDRFAIYLTSRHAPGEVVTL